MTDPILERDPKLAEIIRRLVAAYQPERIYLFGSVARGEAGPDSDYDLLVVVPDDAPPEQKRSRLAYEALRGTANGDRRHRMGSLCLRATQAGARLASGHCIARREACPCHMIPNSWRRHGLGS